MDKWIRGFIIVSKNYCMLVILKCYYDQIVEYRLFAVDL